MIFASDYGNPDEVKKIILRDVKKYIDSYDPHTDPSADLETDDS